MKLIEDKEKRLAERGIFTIEQEIEEIEKRNQELLDKVNEGRVNKIEKVEVYKADEFDDIQDNAPQTEKTKGQEFAEHLKRQFAALDDEQVSVEDLMAIQDFEQAENEKSKKEERNEKACKEISDDSSTKGDLITEIEEHAELIDKIDISTEQEKNIEQNEVFNEMYMDRHSPQKGNFENNQAFEEENITLKEEFNQYEIQDSGEEKDEYILDVLALNEKNTQKSCSETVTNPSCETTEIVSELLNDVISQVETVEKKMVAAEVIGKVDGIKSKSETCNFYEDCLCSEDNIKLEKEKKNEISRKQPTKLDEFKNKEKVEATCVTSTENAKTSRIESAVTSSLVSKSIRDAAGTTFLGSVSESDRGKVTSGINWETIFKPKKVPSVSSDTDEDEDNKEIKVEKPAMTQKKEDDDSNQDILTRIMNNPDSINPFVADMIVKYWNRRMNELRSEQSQAKEPEKKFSFSKPKESPNLADIKMSKDVSNLEKKTEEIDDDQTHNMLPDSSSEETTPIKRSQKQFSLYKNKRFSHFKKHSNKTYLDCQQEIIEEKEDVGEEKKEKEGAKGMESSNEEMESCNEEEETLTVTVAPNYPKKGYPVEPPKFTSSFKYDNTGPNLMEELQRLKKEEEAKPKEVFDKEERMKTLVSQYKMGCHPENEEDSSDDDEEEETKQTQPSTKNIDIRSYSPRTYKGYSHRNFSKIGEKLQSYDFNDQGTERLFGYNIPEKFFFKEDKETGVSHRLQRSIGHNISPPAAHIQTSFSSQDSIPKYSCSGTSTNDLKSSDVFRNIQSKFVSCGTSSKDLPFTSKEDSFNGSDTKLPKGLFMNCAELRDILQKDNEEEDFDGDEKFYSPSTSPQPRFEEITDEEIKELETQPSKEGNSNAVKDFQATFVEINEKNLEEPFLMVQKSSLDAIDENFAKISPKLPSSMSEWRRLGDKMAEETDRKIKAG